MDWKWEYYLLMAHFAELDENNIVVNVVVINNDSLDSSNEEQSGIDFLTTLYGHSNWKQTSYNHNIRKRYACIGGRYDSDLDIFIAPQPYPSWSLNENYDWESPVSKGDKDGWWWWNEETQEWTR